MRTEWSATDSRWWPLLVLLSVVVAAVPLVLEVVLGDQSLWPLVAVPVAAILSVVGASRSRVSLTDAGVEVRRLRTRVYPWTEIASVERAPDWDDPSVIWLRLRSSVPTAAPEVLELPGLGARASERTLDDLVTLVRRRSGLELERPT